MGKSYKTSKHTIKLNILNINAKEKFTFLKWVKTKNE